MARMHSRKKGISGSKKPLTEKKHTWVSYDAKELQQIIIKLAKEQKTASEIGLILRDSYGIPNVKQITEKSITEILKSEKLTQKLPEDMLALIKRAIIIMKHLETNKKDQPSVRGLQLTESKIKRLAKYYKSRDKLDPKWRYSRDGARLMID